MKRVVFAMIEAGGGHKSPARAVKEALDADFPGSYSTRMMDFVKDIGCVKVDRTHKEGWNFLVGQPFITHILFQLENSLPAVARAAMYRSLAAPVIPSAIRFLKHERPDAVFSTHFLNTMILVEARKLSGVDFELFTYHTELFTYHAFWKLPETDWSITASERAAQGVARHGVAKEKIRVFPYPVRNDFLSSRRPREIVAAELGLDTSRPTLLFSFGNQGVGAVLQYLLAIELLNVPLNLIVVAGRNAALRRRAEAFAGHFPHINILPIGYATNMNELIGVSDVCFIKPGPATTMECMHSRKPIIFGNAATPCEQSHANYAVYRGVGKYAADAVTLFAAALMHYLKAESRAEVARRYAALELRSGASDIAAFVDATLRARA